MVPDLLSSKRTIISLVVISLVVPSSCAYVTSMITNGEPLLISKLPEYLHALSLYWLFRIWIVSEIIFYFNFLYKRSTLQLKIKPEAPLNKQQRTELFWNCVYTIKDLKSWCEGWFYYKNDHSHPSISEIREENLALW
jgi:hypothetical protein